MALSGLDFLPALDLRCLLDEQLLTAETASDEFRIKHLMPAFRSDADLSCALLDQRVGSDLLGFDCRAYRAVRQLAQKWCSEPSVHGGKGTAKGSQVGSLTCWLAAISRPADGCSHTQKNTEGLKKQWE